MLSLVPSVYLATNDDDDDNDNNDDDDDDDGDYITFIEHLLCVSCCAKHYIWISLLNFHKNCYCPHVIDEGTEAQTS